MNNPAASNPWPLPAVDIPTTYCHAPTGLDVAAVNDMVTFKWQSPHDNDGFYLRYWTGDEVPNQITVFGTTVQLQLEPEKVWQWGVRTMCNRLTSTGSDEVLGLSFATGKETVGCPVIDISDALIIKSGNVVRVQWTALAGVMNYKLDVRVKGSKLPPPSFNSPTNYINFSHLTPNTEYEWRVTPDCIDAKPSQWAEFTSGAGSTCPAPGLSVLVKNDSAVAFWKEAADDTNYRIYLDGTLIADDHPVNMISFNSLKPSTLYTLVVIGLCPGGMSDMSVQTFTTEANAVSDPTNLEIIITAEFNAVIQWAPAGSITGQILLLNGSMYELDANTNSFAVNNIAPYSKISAVVKSVKDGMKSKGISVEKEIPGYCPEPAQPTVISFNHNSVRIAWPMLSGVLYYQVAYKKQSDVDWIETNTQDTNVEFKMLESYTAYVFRVISNCKLGLSQAVIIGATTAQKPVCPPVIMGTPIIGETTIEIPFTAADGSPAPWGTYMAVAARPLTTSKIQLGKESPIIIKNTNPNTEYTLSVRNLSCDGDFSVSNSATATTLPVCAPPTGLVATLTSNNTILNISWNTVLGAALYGIKYKLKTDSEWTTLDDQAALFITIPDVTSGIYDVQVDSVFASGRRCPVSIISAAPKVLNVENDTTGTLGKFTWDEIKGAEFYEALFVSASESFKVRSSKPKIETKLDQLLNYSVTVRAYNGLTYGPASDAIVFNTGAFVYKPAVECEPPFFKAYSQDSAINDPALTQGEYLDITVNIDKYNNRLKYEIQVIAKQGLVPVQSVVKQAQDQNFLGKVNFVKVPFGEYIVRITSFVGTDAYCEHCNAVYSATVPPVEELIQSDVADTHFKACWKKIDNSEGYMVYLDNELITITTALCYTFENLTPDKDYKVRVRNKAGECLFSDETEIDVHTTPTEVET